MEFKAINLHEKLSEDECKVMLVEPAGTMNTGDAGGAMTADHTAWI